ncbi:MAG: two-component system sensor histidine kinase CreC [Verrucomicrobiae bacterium]|nr:two-component system sensor histidine kinase CreC [Verrucomicrobiae bacterium]
MRITLLIIAGFLVIAGSGFFLLMRTIRDDVERQYSQAAEEPLVDLSHLLAAMVEQDLLDGQVDASRFRQAFESAYRREFHARIYQLEKTKIDTHVYVTDREGIVRFDSDGGRREGEDFSRMNDVFLTLRGEYGARATRTDPEDSRSSVFHVAAPIRWQGEIIGSLTVSRPETVMAPFVNETKRRILRSSIIAGVVVVTLGALWTYWLLSPIGRLTRRARQVKNGEYVTVPEIGHAEIRTLSRALEEMRRELEGRHYVENYVQALTHELKSPLAAIRGAAELLDEEGMAPEQRARFLENIRAETDRSEDLVRRLLQLASIERQSELKRRETIDLPELVVEECAKLRSLAESKRVRIDFTPPESGSSIRVSGDSLMLAIAVRNLLTNAIDFSPENGKVAVSLIDDNPIHLRIEDEGPGMPDYAAARVFDRFYSLKHSVTGRKGSGLGLCFARETARLHAGEVTLENREENQGARATLMLPASPQPSVSSSSSSPASSSPSKPVAS